MSTLGEPALHEYILGADESERARLLAQSEIHRGQAERLFDRLHVPCGGSVIDIGCGPLGVFDLLSTMVGPDGRAIGVDNEPLMIAHARQTIAEWKLSNVELALADAVSTGVDGASLELAHERLVLINHPAPDAVVAEMARLVRPGGWVVLQEVDMFSWICEPAHPAWTELLDALDRAWTAAGLDPFIGRRLPALLRDAGLTDVDFDAQALLWRAGHPYQALALRLAGIFRDRILRAGLLEPDRFDELTAAAELHLARPDTFVIHPMFFQAWARKPA